MGETEDPRAALTDKAVATRAAAVRDLARDGGLEDALTLIGLAAGDKSASVRLVAAGAAAEILLRLRRRGLLNAADEPEIARRVAAVDPAANPSLLLCYAAIPSPAVEQRLARMLRDPRNGVRGGAGMAIRHLALSAGAMARGPGLREWVAEALASRKLAPDAAIDVARLVGEAGWAELVPALGKLGAVDGALAEAIEVARQRVAARKEPASWAGIWVDEGLDVMEPGEPVLAAWRAVIAPEPGPGGLALAEGPARLIWAPRPREEGVHPALQAAGRTWWRRDGAGLASLVDAVEGELAGRPADAAALLDALEGGEGAGASRARMVVAWRLGRFERVLAEHEAMPEAKRGKGDLAFLAGIAMIELGRAAEGRALVAAWLDKAKKKDPWRSDAERCLA